MAVVGHFDTLLITWLTVLPGLTVHALYTASRVGAVKSCYTACRCQDLTLDPLDLK